jgi:hypothetical protein
MAPSNFIDKSGGGPLKDADMVRSPNSGIGALSGMIRSSFISALAVAVAEETASPCFV